MLFAFSSAGLKEPDDFVKNAARAVKAGLAADAAVRALTINAAKIAGVADRLGSLEAGKIANVIVTDGDLFEDKTSVKHVFIDGRLVKLVTQAGRGISVSRPTPRRGVRRHAHLRFRGEEVLKRAQRALDLARKHSLLANVHVNKEVRVWQGLDLIVEPSEYRSARLQLPQRRRNRQPRGANRREQPADQSHQQRIDEPQHEQLRRHPERERHLAERLEVHRRRLVAVEREIRGERRR